MNRQRVLGAANRSATPNAVPSVTTVAV